MVNNKNPRPSLVHAVADCQDCDFEDGWYITAVKSARDHAKKTGHKVVVETGYSKTYNEKGE